MVYYDVVDGYSWDFYCSSSYFENYFVLILDQVFFVLVIDFDQWGLLDEILVVVMGEMGWIFKVNDKWGCGYWSIFFLVVVVGVGV